VRERFDQLVGRLELTWAVVLHRTAAKKEQWLRWQARRNLALCRAEQRGLSPKEIAEGIGLSEPWVKKKIKEGRKVEQVGVEAVVREAGAEEDAA
jgi:hypothetical protein